MNLMITTKDGIKNWVMHTNLDFYFLMIFFYQDAKLLKLTRIAFLIIQIIRQEYRI